MRAFYTRMFGMLVDERRPDIGIDGFWLRSALPGGEALIHVFADKNAQIEDGSIPTGTAAVHHLSFMCQGFDRIRSRCVEHGLQWRGSLLPTVGLWQLFVYDPNGILLELTFEAGVEGTATPVIPPQNEFDAQDRTWFDRGCYEAFDR
jgi:catechol 2,3-dioxygenase-like lactoylglutathione lyase family enzyme